MHYKTIVYFEDLQDNSYPYNVGDEFPRMDVVVTEARLKELSTSKNRRGMPLIVKVEEDGLPKRQKRKKS